MQRRGEVIVGVRGGGDGLRSSCSQGFDGVFHGMFSLEYKNPCCHAPDARAAHALPTHELPSSTHSAQTS
ncbi:hypothetical protein FH972_001752 [Carpinus fangiana]|uniref:Uncharacterized protein n=1 Tax=Carpinus fangiana TaxID=176857 RepID=A0A5N6QD19_9ROSI|nr:hypothetical protein FH972_001752 [Carpinus fangiana]